MPESIKNHKIRRELTFEMFFRRCALDSLNSNVITFIVLDSVSLKGTFILYKNA